MFRREDYVNIDLREGLAHRPPSLGNRFAVDYSLIIRGGLLTQGAPPSWRPWALLLNRFAVLAFGRQPSALG
jgi:hypothetical protein